MFKSQMKCQKILCFVCLILAAVLFVYAIGFVTSLYDLLSIALDKDLGYDFTRVPGAEFYWELQTKVRYIKMDKIREVGFIDQLVGVAIADILVALTLFVTNTHKRRLYHIGNYITTGIFAGYNVSISVWIMIRLAYFKSKYMAIDFDALKALCEEKARAYTPNAPIHSFNLGFAIAALLILAAVAVVLNLIWKIMLQKRENKLLNQSSVQEVAVNG